MERMKETLQSYPSSFDVSDIIKSFSNEQTEQIRSKLLHELNSSVDESSTTMEKVRVLNLLSYLCFILGELENAIDYNRKALETDQRSIIALSNKAWLSLEGLRNYSVCFKACEQLRELQKDEMVHLTAKAEIAYTYSRLGLKNYDKAFQEFKKVIEKLNLQHISSEIATEYYCVWMYGCALSLRRLCNLNNTRDIFNMEQIKDNYKYLVELYSRIIELCADQSKCIQRYQARSYVEVGSIAYDVTRKTLSFPHGMASLFPENSSHILQTREYFSKALILFPDDVFVLERSGRFFRYNREFQLSVDLLKKAISIKETSFGHHHIALSYKRLLELDSQKDQPRHFNSMTIDKKLNMKSGTRQNAKAKEVEPLASCNQELVKYKRSKINEVLHGCSRKYPNINTPADMRGYFEGKRSQTQHSKPQKNKKRDKVQFDQICQLQPREKYGTKHHTADDTSNNWRRRKTYCDERKDKPAVKCPRDPILINYETNKEEVDKIFSHLDRATELSVNTTAQYDKAILYRQIKQPVKALRILEKLMKQQLMDVNSPVMLANIYEQAAFCISAILDETNYVDPVTVELECSRGIYLKSSVEISCDVVAKMPHLHGCWESASTLKNILLDRSSNERNKETLCNLWFLYDKLNCHFEAIGVLKELKDLVEIDEQPMIIEDLVRQYMHLGNYEKAVIALRMTKQLQNNFPEIDQELYLEVHIKAGLDAFNKKHVKKARSRIRQALDFQCGSDARLKKIPSDEEFFELFVLSNLDCDDGGRNLTTFLSELGVRSTFHNDSHFVIPGRSVLQSITKIMTKSEAFAILVVFDVAHYRKDAKY